MSGKKPGKGRRMGSSRRDHRGHRIQRGEGNQDGVERLVEEDNFSNGGQGEGGGADEARTHEPTERQSGLLLPSLEIDPTCDSSSSVHHGQSHSPVHMDLKPALLTEGTDLVYCEKPESSLLNDTQQSQVKMECRTESESPACLAHLDESGDVSSKGNENPTCSLNQDAGKTLFLESVEKSGVSGSPSPDGTSKESLHEDESLETSHSNRRERKRKLGSTRKNPRKAEMQSETGEEEDAIWQERKEKENLSLLEQELSSEIVATLGAVQPEKKKETMIYPTTDENNGMDCEVGDNKGSGILTHTPEASDDSERAEQPTFLVGEGRGDKKDRQEEKVMEQAGTFQTPDISDYSEQAEHSSFVKEETYTDKHLSLATESVAHSTGESTKHETPVEDMVVLDQLNQWEDSQLPVKSSAFSGKLNDSQWRSPELEDHVQKRELGATINKGENSLEEENRGDVLFSLSEENEQEKIKENKKREEERNLETDHTVVSDGHFPTILEQSQNSTPAEQVETTNLQGTQLPLVMKSMPFKHEGEITVQGRGDQGQTDERGKGPGVKDKSADAMECEDTTVPQETSFPVPARRERRRKLGSTRKSCRMAEVQPDTSEEEHTKEHERDEAEDSQVKEALGSETAAPSSGEIQAENLKKKGIHHIANEEKETVCLEGDRGSSGIFTETLDISDCSGQAEFSTFLVEEEGDKQERHEARTMQKAGSQDTSHISDYSDQGEHSSFVREEIYRDKQLKLARTESVGESTKYENLVEDMVVLDQHDQLEDSQIPDKDSALSTNLNDPQWRSPELEDHVRKSEVGEMMTEGENSLEEENRGDVLLSLAEENGQEKIKESKEREEERNIETDHTVVSNSHSSSILEQYQNSTHAEQVETTNLQGTQLPLVMGNMLFRREGEITIQGGEEDQEQSVERGREPGVKAKSPDAIEYEDTTEPQETSFPVPTREERGEKLGLTRKNSGKAEGEPDMSEEEHAMGLETDKGEDPSLLEEALRSETATPSSGEIQAENLKKKSIHYTTDEEKRMECLVGDGGSSGIFTQTTDVSDVSEQAEHCSFLVENEGADTEVTQETRVMEQTETFSTSDIAEYFDQAEHPIFVKDEAFPDIKLIPARKESIGDSVGENRKHENFFEDEIISDKPKQLEDSLLPEDAVLSAQLNDSQWGSPELEDHVPNEEEGEMRNVVDDSLEEENIGNVLLSLAKEDGHEKIKENKERDEERNPETDHTVVSNRHSHTIFEQSQNCIPAEQVESTNLLGTQPPLFMENTSFRHEGEITVQEGEDDQEQSDERGEEPEAKNKSADAMEHEDTTVPHETSLPVPTRRERRRKLGSTRKSSRKAEVQPDTSAQEHTVRRERDGGEDPSLLEEAVGSETAAPTSGEIQAENLTEKRIHYITNEEVGIEILVGDGGSSGILSQTTEVSEDFEQAEPSTFLVEKKGDDKEERQEERVTEQARSYDSSHISDYSDQAENSSFVREEPCIDIHWDLARTESVAHSAGESTKHETPVEDIVILDQLNLLEDSLSPDKRSAFNANHNDSQWRSTELESHVPISEEGEMRNVGRNSLEEEKMGYVSFSPAEEAGQEKINENKEREEERNPEPGHTVVSDHHSPTVLEQSQNSTPAEQVEPINLLGTQLPLVMENMPFGHEDEIPVQGREGDQGQTEGRGEEPGVKDKSADAMEHEDTTVPHETSFPVPARRERRRKLGSTRKSYRMAEVQPDTSEEEHTKEHKRDEAEDSQVKEALGSETAAPSSGEIQTENLTEKRPHYITNEEVGIECFVGDGGSSGIFTQTTEVSEDSEQVEPSTFLVEKKGDDKEERQEERMTEQARSYDSSHISDNSDQTENSSFVREEPCIDIHWDLARTESVAHSAGESTKHGDLVEDTVILDQLNLLEDSLPPDKRSAFNANHDDSQWRSTELESHVQNSEEGEMRNVGRNSLEEEEMGYVSFSPAEEAGQEKANENKEREEREEERNPETDHAVVSDHHSPTILEQSQNSTPEQVEPINLQGTQLPLVMENMPFGHEDEITVQGREGDQGQTDERGEEPGVKDKSADAMEHEDTTVPRETSLPVPARRERRRKLGSTRKSYRMAEVQPDMGAEEHTMGLERDKRDDPSPLEETLGSETSAPSSGEIQADNEKEKSFHYTTDQERGTECQVANRESSGISTHIPEASADFQQAEHSTFVRDREPDSNTQLRESIGHSLAENTKHENLFEDKIISDNMNQSEDSLLPDKDAALCLNLNDFQQRSPELEDHVQKSEEGQMRNGRKNSQEDSMGDVLFTPAEENGHGIIKENMEGEVLSHGYSSAVFEPSHISTTAEHMGTPRMHGTQLPLVTENTSFRNEGEISLQEGERYKDQVQTDESPLHLAETDMSADTAQIKNTTLHLETSPPVPACRERKRKLGSTRKSSRRPGMKTGTGEEAAMGEEGQKAEESSVLELALGSVTSVPPGEIQAEKLKDISSHQSTEHSTFSEEKAKENMDKREEQEMDRTTEISDQSVQLEWPTLSKEFESILNIHTTPCRKEIVGSSFAENAKHENLIEGTVLFDQLNPPGENLLTEEKCDPSVGLHDSLWRSPELDSNIPLTNQPKMVGQHNADEHDSSAVPHRRRKMGSTRKGLLHSANQGEREQSRERSEKNEGEKAEMGGMFERNYADDTHRRERGIDDKVALKREIEGEGKEMLEEKPVRISDSSNVNIDPSSNVVGPQLQTTLHSEGSPLTESSCEAKMTQISSSDWGYKDLCTEAMKNNRRDGALEDTESIGGGKMENEKGRSAVDNMKGDEPAGMLKGVSHQNEDREERVEKRSKKEDGTIMSSIQSPAFLEPTEASTFDGKQESKASAGATKSPAVRKKLGSSRRGRTSAWKGDADPRKTAETGVAEDPKASGVLQRIQEVFHQWDPEEKGFITWDHMQGLGGDLGLSVEELRLVFDQLDTDRDGLVTAQDVTAGFRECMQFQQPRSRPVATVYQSDASILPEEVGDSEGKPFLSMLDDLKAYSLLRNQSEMWNLWVELQHNEPHLLNNLEDFVSNVTEQIKTVQQEKESLELALKRHIQQHSVGVKELYEEMERQIRAEKERIKTESLLENRNQLAQVEEELDQRNREIYALNSVQNQLEGRLQQLLRQQQQSGAEKQELSRANQELEEQLESIRGQLQETLNHVHALRSGHGLKQPHPQLLSPTERGRQTEDFSRPEELNFDSNVPREKRDISHQAMVLERSGSVLDHWFPQDSCTGAKDDSRRRVISIEEDPIPDLLILSQVPPLRNQGEALWEKQRGQARDSLSVSDSPSAIDLLYNVVLVGNSGVGKTCFMKRFQSGEFSPDLCATVGVDSCIQTVQVDGRRVILQVWDTAGQERYHSITKQILRKAQGLLLMYDITSSQSFVALRYWLSSIQEGASDDVIIMLLGNKNDSSKREVSLEEGQRLAREYNIHFMECSVATGNNVVQAMNSLARMLKQQVDDKQEGNVTLQNRSPKKKSGCCG